MKQNHTEKQTEQVDHVRPYELYVVILRDNSNYFVGNVRRHEKGTIFIEDGYETFIPTEQIFAEVAISDGQFTVFKHLNAADLLRSLKQIDNKDIGRLDALGKKKVVKRPTKHLADAHTHRAQTSSLGYLGSSLGYLGSLLDPISVKDWLYGKTNTLNRKKLRIDQIADVGIRTVMQAGERGGAALGKYIKTRKRTAALANTSEQKVSHAYDSSESSSSEDSSSKEEKAAPTSPPTNRRQARQSRKLDNPGGGFIHDGIVRGRQGGTHQQTDEKRNRAQATDRDKRTYSRSTRGDTYERIKKGRRARVATARKKKNNLFAGFKQFVSL